MFKEEEMIIVTSWNIDQTIDLRVGERRKKNDSRLNVCKNFILRQWDDCKSTV